MTFDIQSSFSSVDIWKHNFTNASRILLLDDIIKSLLALLCLDFGGRFFPDSKIYNKAPEYFSDWHQRVQGKKERNSFRDFFFPFSCLYPLLDTHYCRLLLYVKKAIYLTQLSHKMHKCCELDILLLYLIWKLNFQELLHRVWRDCAVGWTCFQQRDPMEIRVSIQLAFSFSPWQYHCFPLDGAKFTFTPPPLYSA